MTNGRLASFLHIIFVMCENCSSTVVTFSGSCQWLAVGSCMAGLEFRASEQKTVSARLCVSSCFNMSWVESQGVCTSCMSLWAGKPRSFWILCKRSTADEECLKCWTILRATEHASWTERWLRRPVCTTSCSEWTKHHLPMKPTSCKVTPVSFQHSTFTANSSLRTFWSCWQHYRLWLDAL